MTEQKKYNIGYIYKLFSHVDETFYIGATSSPMRIRMYHHKKKPPNKKVTEWFADIGFNNVKYEIIAEYKEVTKRELESYETVEIRKYLNINDNCLNCKVSYITTEERHQYCKDYSSMHKEEKRIRSNKSYQDNKDAVKARVQQYRDVNKETIAAKFREVITCDHCDKRITKYSLTRHKNTKKCKDFIKE